MNMAKHVNITITADTGTAMRVLSVLKPFVFLRILSPKKAAAIVVRFVRMKIDA